MNSDLCNRMTCFAVLWIVAAGVYTLGAACRPAGSSGERPTASPEHLTGTPDANEHPVSPSDTLRLVRQYRAQGAFNRLRDYLVPEQREAVIDHLLAVDELVMSYRLLNHVVAERVGQGSATAFDPQAVANIVGVFSRDVTLVDEVVDGDRATITISVAGRVPVEHVEMVMPDDVWLVKTDTPVIGLASEIRKLAEATDHVVFEIRSRDMTAEDVREELNLRQRPILERIKQLTEAQAAPAP